MNGGGYVAIYRAAFDHPLFATDSARLGAWIWLLGKACWKPTPFDIAGRIVSLERGQLCASRSQLARAWGMSPSAVERFLTRLETEQMIGRATGQGRSIITIRNYDKFQAVSDEAGQATGQRSDSYRTAKEEGNKGTIEPTGSSPLCISPAKSKRAAKLPDDWQPILTDRSKHIVAGWPPGKFEHELRRFADHAADKGRVSKDWQAAFRTWIDKADEWMKRNGRASENSEQHGDGFARAIERRLHAGDAECLATSPNRPAIRDGEGPCQGALALPSARH
ncbi:helix-turn-helix domain-containing protein [Erythrobacter fulvus]|nr:helix-turn-helix domain-containing protein [Erythrobacter fulvus]